MTRTYNHNGKALTLKELSLATGIAYQTLLSRAQSIKASDMAWLIRPLSGGYSAELHCYKGEGKNIHQWADDIGISRDTFRARVKRHGIEKAVEMGRKKLKIHLPREQKTLTMPEPWDDDLEMKTKIDSYRAQALKGLIDGHNIVIKELEQQNQALANEVLGLKAAINSFQPVIEEVLFHDNRYGRFKDEFYEKVLSLSRLSPEQSLAEHDAEVIDKAYRYLKEIYPQDFSISAAFRVDEYTQQLRSKNA